jgi:flagellar basal-body rod modification protein FlgD
MQDFIWDGKSANGTQWPDGNYKMTLTAQDTSGQAVVIPTEVEGVVNSVDITKSPPTLSVADQEFTLDKIKRIVRR